jgi:hypothetical protein
LATSDAGNGVGYTGFRIRGTAGTSINVMLNGVPYNDSESQGTFFVNIPDMAKFGIADCYTRGVGTSSNGTASFGASVNILTKDPDAKPYFLTNQSAGSFSTYKHSFEAGTGKFLNNMLSVSARYSLINSDGYIDRASSKLRSFNINALFEKGNTKIRFLTFGGKEKTYQAWNGIDKATWKLILNLIILEQFMMITETSRVFIIMKRIIIGKIIITCFGNKNFLKNGILKQLFILRMEKVTTKITSKTLSFLNMICQILQKMEIQLPEQISLEKNG